MNCPKCNYPNDPRNKFCQNCGSPLLQNANKPKSEKYGLAISSFVLGILGFVFTFIVIGIVPAIIGLILGIVSIAKDTKKKGMAIAGIVISIIAIMLFVILVISTSDRSNNKNEEDKAIENEVHNSDIEKNNDTREFSDGLELYKSGEYVFVSNADLQKYASNMKDVKVYTVVEISDMKTGVIQANLIDDGFMMSDFEVGDRYESYSRVLSEGDEIAVLGIVDSISDYGIAGSSVTLKDCYVFSKENDAQKYKKEKSSDELSQYFSVNEEVANTSDITEEEYRNLCKEYSYDEIVRTPDNYKEKYCKLTGTVSQSVEGWFGQYTIYISDTNGNIWGCTYSYDSGEAHMLEGDQVTVYGMLDGTTTSETVLGKQVEMPYLNIKYR